jgi:hypothetical protein
MGKMQIFQNVKAGGTVLQRVKCFAIWKTAKGNYLTPIQTFIQ